MTILDIYSGTESVENVVDQMNGVIDVCAIPIKRSCRIKCPPERIYITFDVTAD